ncbi:hypothetical protein CCR75_005231 [Bremia lactucae]|uniref:Uncharacterized protein n=1 Tax=Bremia lactucae TaxID=4779 RepID=A0A976FGZ5_BRELC|nr:hypothetical protein CCR75_005231 [Bremia lactucae]
MPVSKGTEAANYNSDSDGAPEVLTKESATEHAIAQQHQLSGHHSARRKRKIKPEAELKDKTLELPDDVLLAVAARTEEAVAVDSRDELRAKKQRAVKRARLEKQLQTKTHTRQFGNIQVQTLEALENTQTRELSTDATEFLMRKMAPSRARMNVLEGHPSQFTKIKQK